MTFALLAILAAAAAPGDHANSRYLECVALVMEDIAAGRKAAQFWADNGGGPDAQHCLALADIAAGFPKLGAARLEEIAQRKDAGDDYVRARLLAQASEAWIEAGDTGRASAAIANAFKLTPTAGELYLTTAKVDGAKENWIEAIQSVDAAETAGFVSAETYLIRARAYKALGDFLLAAQDVANALKMDPANIDAYILRGELQQLGVKIDVRLTKPESE
jgi:tetratricopeptide (TPR) repeat protein